MSGRSEPSTRESDTPVGGRTGAPTRDRAPGSASASNGPAVPVPPGARRTVTSPEDQGRTGASGAGRVALPPPPARTADHGAELAGRGRGGPATLHAPRRKATTRAAPPSNGATAPDLPASEAPVEDHFFEVPAAPRRQRRQWLPTEPFEPEPFASPREVGTDAPLLLVRDPSTLFVFWDFRRELERGAALGIRDPKLLLRLYRGSDLDRSLELPLAARSTYVTGLTPGQEYVAEILLLGRDGWTRPMGSRSATRRLPPGRVSAQLEVRTLRLPWSEPISGAHLPSIEPSLRLEPLDSPRRVQLPTSPGARGPSDGSGPSGGRSGRN